jgi:hypothetical protein
MNMIKKIQQQILENVLLDALTGDVKIATTLLLKAHLAVNDVLQIYPSDLNFQTKQIYIAALDMPITMPTELIGILKHKSIRLTRLEAQQRFFGIQNTPIPLLFSDSSIYGQVISPKTRLRLLRELIRHEVSQAMTLLGITAPIHSLRKLLTPKKFSSNKCFQISPPKTKSTPLMV